MAGRTRGGVKLAAMKTLHLIVPDLLLPSQFAAEVTADLSLPFLQKILARAERVSLPARSMEAALCAAFAVDAQHDLPIAPISAAYDGLPDGCWLRADPVHLRLQRDRLLLLQTALSAAEAAQFCAALNEYFAGQGMRFHAPHPQRWYVQLESVPQMQTTSFSEVLGGNVRGVLPQGADAGHWQRLSNEMQMLLHSHALNEAREARGELPVNSLWLWGGGQTPDVSARHDAVCSDDSLCEMFAVAAGISHRSLALPDTDGTGLMVCSALRNALHGGDLHAWRAALLRLEAEIAQPLWRALRSGAVQSLQLEVVAGENSARYRLGRAQTWRFWRPAQRLAAHSLR